MCHWFAFLYGTWYFTTALEELSRVMSELGSGERGEALVRALVPHQCGLGSGLGM